MGITKATGRGEFRSPKESTYTLMGMHDWLSDAVSIEDWQPLPGAALAGGIMQGMFVTNGVEVAYLKPSPGSWQAEPAYCPALERVAARLAFEVQMPVPPVQLYLAKAPDGTSYPSCLSYVASSAQPFSPKWSAVMGGMFGDEALKAGQDAIAGYVPVVAFDAWLATSDRHGGNAVLAGYDDMNVVPRWQSIDYSRSMIWHGWWRERKEYDTITIEPLVDLIVWLQANGSATLMEAVARIEALPETTIQRFVRDVPDEYLGPERGTLIEGLLDRQRNLQKTVTQWLRSRGIA